MTGEALAQAGRRIKSLIVLSPMTEDIMFDNSYAKLPEHFFARVKPVPVKKPYLIKFNEALARDLGMDLKTMDEVYLTQIFSGNKVPDQAEPIAMAYAGFQFGNFVPKLGDGRAILLGEIVDTKGVRRDIQLKGSGRTPFSRHADGRSPIGPVIREYIVSEAMYALGIHGRSVSHANIFRK